MKILIDTNMFISCVRYKIDIFRELHGHELITLSNCFNELAKLSEKRSKPGGNARIALIMILAKDVKTVRGKEKRTDKAILEYALKNNCYVATNDRKLIKSLKKNGIRIIRLRQKKFLIEE